MKAKNFIQIQGWMVTDLQLSGNYLLAYALIYGFSQDGQSEFTGSINYVCKWLRCSRPTAIKVLKELTEQNLIEKNQVEVNNVTFNKYSANLTSAGTNLGGSKDSLLGVKNLNGGSKDSLPGGSKDSLPNNTINNNTKYNDDDVLKNIDTLINDYLKDPRLVKAVIENNGFRGKSDLERQLKAFNKHLDQLGDYLKSPKDYKSHFRNWHKKQKNGKAASKSPTDITL